MHATSSRVLGFVKVELFLLCVEVVLQGVLLLYLDAKGFNSDVIDSALTLHDLQLSMLVNNPPDRVNVVVLDLRNQLPTDWILYDVKEVVPSEA